MSNEKSAPLTHTNTPIEQHTPIISQSTAVLLSTFYVFIYVAPFYLSAKTRPSQTLSRDAPPVISARVRAVTLSCVASCIITSYVATRHGDLSLKHLPRLYGWWPVRISDVINSLALVCILFAGPLFERGIVEGQWRSWIRGGTIRETLQSSMGWRNYVAAPATEEHTFRSMLIALHLLASPDTANPDLRTLIFYTPLYFGLAHLHHAYEFRLTHPGIPMLPVVLQTLFQFVYTSLFGFYAAFLHLRTGSLLSAILTHTFCNWMGLPRFWGRIEGVEVSASMKGGVVRPAGAGTDEDREHPAADGRLGIAWTAAYYAILVAGAWGFYLNLWRLTESENALVEGW